MLKDDCTVLIRKGTKPKPVPSKAPVRAALVSFAEPQYRNAVEVHMATRLLSQRRLGQRLGGYYHRLRS